MLEWAVLGVPSSLTLDVPLPVSMPGVPLEGGPPLASAWAEPFPASRRSGIPSGQT